MKPYRMLTVIFVGAALAFSGLAQEKPKAEGAEKHSENRKTITPLRVQVVFSEFDGEKKISSLPYTLLVNSDVNGPMASIRMGLRVPVHTAESGAMTYLDMGTSLDCRSERQEDGRFLLGLSVERSSAYSPQGNIPDTKTISANSPVIQQFRSQLNLLVRDGQTLQTTVSTDPVTGRAIKVDVTVNIVK